MADDKSRARWRFRVAARGPRSQFDRLSCLISALSAGPHRWIGSELAGSELALASLGRCLALAWAPPAAAGTTRRERAARVRGGRGGRRRLLVQLAVCVPGRTRALPEASKPRGNGWEKWGLAAPAQHALLSFGSTADGHAACTPAGQAAFELWTGADVR